MTLLPLAARRRFPLTVLVTVCAAFIAFRVLQVPEGTVSSVALFLALYTAGAHSVHPARDWVRGAAILVSMGLVVWALLSQVPEPGISVVALALFSVGINIAFFVAAWLLGDLSRIRRQNEKELARRAEQLAAEREERARRAVLDERVRIARELHDVVAHHVSVMGIQAAAARKVMSSAPEVAARALERVEEAGRQAVAELQRAVGILREGGDAAGHLPQPTLADLDRLVAQVREAGLPVELHRVGSPRPLPASVELSAYRIVQEALTNTLKHAGEVATRVLLTHTQEGLEVEVVDEGRTRGRGGEGGRGLLGMRERVAMLGGSLQAGPLPGGGFRVHARLPAREREWSA